MNQFTLFLLLTLPPMSLGCGDANIDSETANAAKSATKASGRRQPAGSYSNQTAPDSQNPATDAPGSPETASPVVFQGSRSNTRTSSADWRQFRGPNGAGVSNATGLPTKWSATENIAWKRRLPGPGASSPIVVGNRIYVTCYSGYGLSKSSPGEPKNLKRHLLCLDRKTGRILWNTPVSHERQDHGYSGFMQLHGYASSTPVSDGKRIYAYFGNWGAYAFDRDGKQLWRFDCGSRVHGFGSGASPVLHGKLLIVNASVESGTLIALDKTTGQEVWRSKGAPDAWNTPQIVNVAGRDEVVVCTRSGILGFDAKSGRSLWNWAGMKAGSYVCPSLVQHNGILYGLAANAGPVAAIRPGGTGDVSKSHTAWTAPRFRTTVTSPVFHNGHLYYPHDEGSVMACFDGATGAEKKRVRARPGFGRLYASPLVVDKKIYIVTRLQGTFVFKATPDMEQISHNKIAGDDSIFNGSPVPHNGQLLIRSDKFLYCIGKKQ